MSEDVEVIECGLCGVATIDRDNGGLCDMCWIAITKDDSDE